MRKLNFYKKNKEKYEIVSIDGKAVNKQLRDTWGEDYSVVSKAPAGTRVIKVVYKVNKGSFDIHYRLKGTDQELTTAEWIITKVKNTMFPLFIDSKPKKLQVIVQSMQVKKQLYSIKG